jgi:hypothetical protein
MTDGTDSTPIPSPWSKLCRELITRCTKPIGQPTFVIYFLVFIVLIGALGVLIKLGKIITSGATPQDHLSLAQDLSTYLFALIAASLVDLLFSESAEMPSLKMFALSLFVVGVIFGVISQFSTSPVLAIPSALIGTLLALFLWWIANYDNAKLIEPEPDARDAIGGDTTQIAGSTKVDDF